MFIAQQQKHLLGKNPAVANCKNFSRCPGENRGHQDQL